MFILNQHLFNSKNSPPLPGFRGDISAFINEWTRCTENPTKDTSVLFTLLGSHIDHWFKMLSTPSYPKDIGYSSLLHYLEHPNPLGVLKQWVRYEKEDVKSILALTWLELLRNPLPLTGAATTQAYVLSRAFVYELSHQVGSRLRHMRKWDHIELRAMLDIVAERSSIDDEVTDILLDVEKEPYTYYLFMLYLSGFDEHGMLRLTKTTTSSVYFWRAVNEYADKRAAIR